MQISENTYKEIEKIIDEICELNPEEKNFKDKYFRLSNAICGLSILQQHQISFNEIELGNVIIDNDILTCILDNKIQKFRMEKRHANRGELVYIVNAIETEPFHPEYIGKCYKVTKQITEEESEWIQNCVVIGYDDKEETPGWCLYDDQYVVLVSLDN